MSFCDFLPSYAVDLKTNIENIFSTPQEGLSTSQLYGIAITVCLVEQNEKLFNIIKHHPKCELDDLHLSAIKSAIAIMLQNNTYYKIFSVIEEPEIKKLESALQMSVLQNPPIDRVDFEIYLLAISIARGCGYCCNVHIKKLMHKGVTSVTIRNILKVVAIIKAAAEITKIEKIRTYDFAIRDQNL